MKIEHVDARWSVTLQSREDTHSVLSDAIAECPVLPQLITLELARARRAINDLIVDAMARRAMGKACCVETTTTGTGTGRQS